MRMGQDRHEVIPREFGRDGVSGLVDTDRAMRARDVSRPTPADEAAARAEAEALVARATRR
ncbi:hypothetical protein GCM10027418_20710 [Mariniluteicoccus endophyticus]